jgi:hypothetical protein
VHQQKSAIQKVRFTKVNESIYSFLFFWKCENGRLRSQTRSFRQSLYTPKWGNIPYDVPINKNKIHSNLNLMFMSLG